MTGSELKAIRKKLGLSLSKAARQVDVTISTWCRWESGKSNEMPFRVEKLFKLVNNIKEHQ